MAAGLRAVPGRNAWVGDVDQVLVFAVGLEESLHHGAVGRDGHLLVAQVIEHGPDEPVGQSAAAVSAVDARVRQHAARPGRLVDEQSGDRVIDAKLVVAALGVLDDLDVLRASARRYPSHGSSPAVEEGTSSTVAGRSWTIRSKRIG